MQYQHWNNKWTLDLNLLKYAERENSASSCTKLLSIKPLSIVPGKEMKSFPFCEKYAILHFLRCTTSNSDCFRVSLQDFHSDDFFLSLTLPQLLHNSQVFKRDIFIDISVAKIVRQLLQFDPFLPITGFKLETLSIS